MRLTREINGLRSTLKDDDVGESSKNIIINSDDLKYILENRTVCSVCFSPFKVSFATSGVATTVLCSCEGDDYHQTIVFPEHKKMDGWDTVIEDPVPKDIDHIDKVLSNVATLDFSINNMFMMMILRSGGGFQASLDFCGFLSLEQPWSSRTYRKCEDKVSKMIIETTEDILDENLRRELEVSPLIDGEIDFCTSFDYGWQQRGSGNIYNSPSGHGLMIGARTKKGIY